MRELLVRKKGHEMSSSWQDTSIVITNCQQPLMLTLGWHKNRPTVRHRWRRGSLLSHLLLRDSGKRGVISFSCVWTGDPSGSKQMANGDLIQLEVVKEGLCGV